MSTKIRTVFNQKGGVGKSSIACNLAAVSAAYGYTTLVVDLDVQGNSSTYLGYDIHDDDQLIEKTGVAEIFRVKKGLFSSKSHPIEFVLDTAHENLSLLASDIELEVMEKELESRYKIYQLRKALTELSKDFDRIYIDTPPNFGFYSKSALIATDSLLIPFDCDTFSKQALYNVINNMYDLREDHNDKVFVEGVIINQFNAQTNLHGELVDELEQEGLPVLGSYISSSVKMKESHQRQLPLINMTRSHKLTTQFVNLFATLEGLPEESIGHLRSSSQLEILDEEIAGLLEPG